MLYDALIVWDALGEINVTETSLPLFRIFDEDIRPGRYSRQSTAYISAKNSILAYADSFIELAARYTPVSGILTDTYNKTDGSPLGGPGYSLSYAYALMSFAARRGYTPRSWGAKFT